MFNKNQSGRAQHPDAAFHQKTLMENIKLKEENKAHRDALSYQGSHHIKLIQENEKLRKILFTNNNKHDILTRLNHDYLLLCINIKEAREILKANGIPNSERTK